MNIKFIKHVFIALVGVALMDTSARAADSVRLTITGNVVAVPCEIYSQDKDQTINLGDIPASALQTPNSVTLWSNFSIRLINCPAGTQSVAMTMHGSADSAHPEDVYTNSGAARNVGVQLQSAAGDSLGDGKTLSGSIASNAYTYNLRTRAISVPGGVTSGSIQSVVTATFVYQ